MARIQILELPVNVVGEYSRTPFAVVIDQVDTESNLIEDTMGRPIQEHKATELTQDEADQIAQRIGAVGAILTACTLDVA